MANSHTLERMIKTHLLASPSERLTHFNDFDQTQQTWIVANIRSKIELQEALIQKHGYFVGDSVLRISEFWKILLAQHFPEKKIISEDLMEFLAEAWISENPWCQLKKSSSDLLLQACHQLNDILFSNQEEDLLAWVAENRPQDRFWERWCHICRNFIHDIAMEKNCLAARWIAGFLHNAFAQRNDLDLWKKKIHLDLGSDLHSCEAQFFSRLANFVDVLVFKPKVFDVKFFKQLKTYDFLDVVDDPNFTQNTTERPDPRHLTSTTQIIHHETALGEVQFAVAQIRQWIEQDHIAPEKILVLFANYDLYWPKFSSLCQLEGVPLDQSMKAKLFDLPVVQSWLSQCWTQYGLFDKEQTYHFLFSQHEQKIPFSQYLQKYSLYEQESDLSTIPALQKAAVPPFTENRPLSMFHSLIELLIKCSENFSSIEDQKILQKCIQTLWQHLSDFPEQNFVNYKKMILKILAHTEVILNTAQAMGVVKTGQLQSCQVHAGQKRIYLGVNQENFLTSSKIYKSDETKDLAKDLNIFFEDDETSLAEFELYWQKSSHFEQTIYSYCGSDFQGDLLSPHHFLTELQYFQNIIPSRFELAQKPTVYSSLGWSDLPEDKLSQMKTRFECDDGLQAMNVVLGPEPLSFSATHLQNYKKCPFIYFAQKILKLKDLPEMDFDIDPLTEGVLVHALFEELVRRQQKNWSAEELDGLLEDLKMKLNLQTFDLAVWQVAKRRYLRTARRFLDFEAIWSKENPASHIDELEKKFEITVSHLFTEKDMPAQLMFQGTIDRIETDKMGNILLVDYKRSTTNQASPDSWVKNNTLQLLFYGWLVKKYHLLGDQKLLGIIHYDYQRMNRESALLHEQSVATVLAGDQGTASIMNNDDFESAFEEIENEIKSLLQRLVHNDFQPKPLDVTQCLKCSWRALCRAPHLNH